MFIVYNTFEFKVFVASILVGPFAPSIQEMKTYFVVLVVHWHSPLIYTIMKYSHSKEGMAQVCNVHLLQVPGVHLHPQQPRTGKASEG